MKILQINSVCTGSTGRIAAGVSSVLQEQGHESLILYGRGGPANGVASERIESKLDFYAHVAYARFSDRQGFASTLATRRMIRKIEAFSPDLIQMHNLHGYYLCVVKPDVAVSTKEAYSAITPKKPAKSCRDIVRQPIETWKEELVNDFEEPIFKMHPELAAIKQKLYDQGAVYASMSGSGSALYGIFKKEPKGIEEQFDGMFCEVMKL